MWRKNLVVAPLLEAALIFIVALTGWLTHQPLVFASLGPTAYEMIETPKRPSARPYNLLVGHSIAVLAAFAALLLTHAWSVPAVSAQGVPLLRVWATAIAALLTVLGTLLARATQPAALSTTILMSSGALQSWKDGGWIMVAVVLMVLVGEPVRRWRVKGAPDPN